MSIKWHLYVYGAIHNGFDNVNPNEVNQAQGLINQNGQNSTGVAISELNKTAECIVIKNSSASADDLNGWKIVSVRGNQSFTFPAFSLATGASVKIGDSASNISIDFHWLDGGGKWNNSESDSAKLYDGTGKQVEALNNLR